MELPQRRDGAAHNRGCVGSLLLHGDGLPAFEHSANRAPLVRAPSGTINVRHHYLHLNQPACEPIGRETDHSLNLLPQPVRVVHVPEPHMHRKVFPILRFAGTARCDRLPTPDLFAGLSR